MHLPKGITYQFPQICPTLKSEACNPSPAAPKLLEVGASHHVSLNLLLISISLPGDLIVLLLRNNLQMLVHDLFQLHELVWQNMCVLLSRQRLFPLGSDLQN